MLSLSLGGVEIKLISLSPVRESCNVLGIGVADMLNESTPFFSCFIFSFAETPNLCSSSIIISPRFPNFIFSESALWVPINISILQLDKSARVSSSFFVFVNLLILSTLTGKSLNLLENVLKC